MRAIHAFAIGTFIGFTVMMLILLLYTYSGSAGLLP